MTTRMTKEQGTCFFPPRSLAMPVMRRSRSLNELPGSIRIPVLKRTDSDRMRARLEASMQGLEELKLLKEQQKRIIDDAMTSSLHRAGRSNNTQNTLKRMSASSLRSSSTSLAKISEETTENDSGVDVLINNNRDSNSCGWSSQRRHSFANTQPSRSRQPVSLADSHIVEQECHSEDERLKKHHSWTSLMHNFYGSQPHALESSRSSECLRRSRSEDIPIVNISGKLGRSQSFCVSSGNSYLQFPISKQEEKGCSNENIQPKLRRASIQCDAVLSGASVDSKQRGLFKDVDLNSLKGNFPNPLRAVLMQYGNSETSMNDQKKNKHDEKEIDKETFAKVLSSKMSEYDKVSEKNIMLDIKQNCDKVENGVRNNRNQVNRNTITDGFGSSDNVVRGIQKISSPSKKNISQEDLIISKGNKNNSDVSGNVQNIYTNSDTRNKKICLDTVSDNSTSLSMDYSKAITKQAFSAIKTVNDMKNIISVEGSSTPSLSHNNSSYNVCSVVNSDNNNDANKELETVHRNKATENADAHCTPSLSVPASVISKGKAYHDSNLNISGYTDIGLSSSAEHDFSISSSSVPCSRKMFSIVSDEGYVTSPPSSPKGRNRNENSIISNGSWICTDLDDASNFEPNVFENSVNEEGVVSESNINTTNKTDSSKQKTLTSTVHDGNKPNLEQICIHAVSTTRPFRQTAV